MVEAIALELAMRSEEIAGEAWKTVYFGGGTPSLLSPKHITQLLEAAHAAKPLAPTAEITLEANPDDLDEQTLQSLKETAVNRLSIGVQSFRESDLRYMNRAHNAQQAVACIARAQAIGFKNLTIDLIYGTPGLDDAAWLANLQRTIDFNVPHISAYALTVEPRTALAHQIKVGKSAPVDEDQAARQMEILIDVLTAAGYEHYEVSNFALPGMRAQHNSNYWLGTPYLGVGPSAHSYDGIKVRSWNVANNVQYVRSILADQLPLEREVLSLTERYNELVLTRLRTVWGVSLAEVAALGFAEAFEAAMAEHVRHGLAEAIPGGFRLTRAGRMVADGVSVGVFQ